MIDGDNIFIGSIQHWLEVSGNKLVIILYEELCNALAPFIVYEAVNAYDADPISDPLNEPVIPLGKSMAPSTYDAVAE